MVLARFIVISVLMGTLAACASSPTPFRDDVDLFADGVKTSVDAYHGSKLFYVSYLESLELRSLLRSRPALLDGPQRGACMKAIVKWQNDWDRTKGIGATAYDNGRREYCHAAACTEP